MPSKMAKYHAVFNKNEKDFSDFNRLQTPILIIRKSQHKSNEINEREKKKKKTEWFWIIIKMATHDQYEIHLVNDTKCFRLYK